MTDPSIGGQDSEAENTPRVHDYSAEGDILMPHVEISSWELPEKLDLAKEKLVRSNLVRPDPLRIKIGCVDGRPYNADYFTLQTLGGFLNTVPLVRYAHWMRGEKVSYEDAFHEGLELLDNAGFQIGFHDGPHGRAESERFSAGTMGGNAPDCGFAKKYSEVTGVLAFMSDELKKLLNHGALQNGIPPIIGEAEERDWQKINETARKIYDASSKNDKQRFLSATEMFARGLQFAGESAVVPLQDEHREEVAHVSLIDGYTLDTNALNRAGSQAFNLDLWLVKKQVQEALAPAGVSESIAALQTLGMYQATERVLRANQPPLPILITHSESQILRAA